MHKSALKILIFLIIFAESAFLGEAAALSLKEISLPEKFAHTVEIYEPSGASSEAAIIHIQDAHCNYEAQKNMAQALEYLVKNYKLKLIMVEGGSGDVSLSYLREYSDKKTREEVAEKYLKAGKISGEEYLDIISDYDLELYGIEDQGLYDAHLESFWQVDAIKEEGLKYLTGIADIATKLKPFIYSGTLRRIEEKKKDYEDKAVSLADYCQYLDQTAKEQAVGLKEYTQLLAFCQTARLEKEIDFKQAEAERNAFIKDLAKLLDENAVKDLLSKSQDFKAAKISPKDYYSFLNTLAVNKLDLSRNYPQLNSYIQYITLDKKIDAGQLVKEVSAAEEKIKASCIKSPEEKKLSEISKATDILARILNLELTPEDYEYFKANRTLFLTASWKDFLSENCQKYNLALAPSASNIIDENMIQLEEFYRLGVEREQAFIKNLANKMDTSGEQIAVLITGGFHTPGITQMLKDRGYAYEVVTPVITEQSDSSVYFSVLKSEKKPLADDLYIDMDEEE